MSTVGEFRWLDQSLVGASNTTSTSSPKPASRRTSERRDSSTSWITVRPYGEVRIRATPIGGSRRADRRARSGNGGSWRTDRERDRHGRSELDDLAGMWVGVDDRPGGDHRVRRAFD